MKKLLFEKHNGVGMITLNRPEKRHAIDYDVMNDLSHVIMQTKNDDTVKVLAITATGEDAFCSGGDLSVFHGLQTAEEAYEMLIKMGLVLFELFTYPKPTVALLNGTAIGGGAEIASACDFRISADHVHIGFIQGTLGITTGWGGTAFLSERISPLKSYELLMSSKQISAAHAYDIGLFQGIADSSDIKSLFLDYVDPFINKTTDVLKAYKKALLRNINVNMVKENVIDEIKTCSLLWESDAHHQAVASFLKKNIN